jgi:hypothetical protein
MTVYLPLVLMFLVAGIALWLAWNTVTARIEEGFCAGGCGTILLGIAYKAMDTGDIYCSDCGGGLEHRELIAL